MTETIFATIGYVVVLSIAISLPIILIDRLIKTVFKRKPEPIEAILKRLEQNEASSKQASQKLNKVREN